MTLRKFKINQIIFGLALLALIVTTSSCKQNPDTQKDDDSKKSVVTNPEGFGFVFIEETTEKLDGKDYVVKAYADSYGSPYLYDYYKYYYLDGKLKKIHVYYHNNGVTDYTYNEFKNYTKENSKHKIEEKIFTYYDSGRLQEEEAWLFEDYYFYILHTAKNYYDIEKNPLRSFTLFNEDDKERSEVNYYYKNGKFGLSKGYEGSDFYFHFNYESGYTRYIYHSYDNKLRTYEDGVYSDDDDIGSEDDYTTEEAYTQEQAIALCNQLIQQYFN